jgi:phosphatidylglycerophosphatase A
MGDVGGFESKVEKLYEDFYIGQGKDNPSVITRLSILEETVESIGKNLSKIVWLLVAIFLTAVGNLVSVHLLR